MPRLLTQAKRYPLDIRLTADEVLAGGPWIDGLDQFRVPFMFMTNGRPYVKQLATKSGTWFWDARTKAPPQALAEWFSPRGLIECLEQEAGLRFSMSMNRLALASAAWQTDCPAPRFPR